MAHWQHCPRFMQHLGRILRSTVIERLKMRDEFCAPDLDMELVREYKIEERWAAWLDGHYYAAFDHEWLKERECVVWEALDRAPHMDPVTVTEVGQGLYTVHEQSDLWVVNMQTAGWLLRTYRDHIKRESLGWKIKHGYQGLFYVPDRRNGTEIFTHSQVKAFEILAWGSKTGYRRYTEVRGDGCE